MKSERKMTSDVRMSFGAILGFNFQLDEPCLDRLVKCDMMEE